VGFLRVRASFRASVLPKSPPYPSASGCGRRNHEKRWSVPEVSPQTLMSNQGVSALRAFHSRTATLLRYALSRSSASSGLAASLRRRRGSRASDRRRPGRSLGTRKRICGDTPGPVRCFSRGPTLCSLVLRCAKLREQDRRCGHKGICNRDLASCRRARTVSLVCRVPLVQVSFDSCDTQGRGAKARTFLLARSGRGSGDRHHRAPGPLSPDYTRDV